MKNELDRELIEKLSESNNVEFLENINNTVYNLLSQVVVDISEKSPFVKLEKCILIPVNEIYLGAVSQLSEYNYFLGLENPQIELNSKSKKNYWKYIWREFKAAWRLGKKKYKKRKEEQKQNLETVDKYKLSSFRHDVVMSLAKYLTETSIIYEHSKFISIVGKNDFGTNVKINIYICTYNSSDGTFKLFNESKNKFIKVNFGNRFENLQHKIENVGNVFVQMVSLINAIYSKTYNKIPNQILVESLINICPNALFHEDDVYKTFINVANYIRLINPKDINSICDQDHDIFEEKLILAQNQQLEFGKIISMLDNFKY